ncbi:MAG: methylmalonyl Co-A mutase-associated GTPase MeaB [Anaerolineae bacterium]|nr:methylmalonyl Co-A mutase-associated GTPase MeaB [Anaerolineae bacterium]
MTPARASADLIAPVLSGDRRALARLITRVENRAPDALEALARLHPHTGRATLIGVTGAPGTGKSTLVNALALALRQRGQTVGIVAVDPTSPFSGGAVLGDRVRMTDLAGDGGVFIRSMASRGSLGGLAAATGDVARVLDAAGFAVVLIETVGAGQSEVDIARMAHTTVVVDAPGLGDDVQAIKAGILEIADILVVNKADRPGAQNTVRALRAMLELGHRLRNTGHHGAGLLPAPPESLTADTWTVPVIETVATEHTGIADVLAALDQHRAHLHSSGEIAGRERQRVEAELLARLREALLARLLAAHDPATLAETVRRVVARELDPASAVRALVAAACGDSDASPG